MTALHERALVMARQVYADYGAEKARQAGDDVNTDWVAKVLAGEADETHGVKIALAAILSTTELAARLVDEHGIFSIAREIRDGAHLTKAPQP